MKRLIHISLALVIITCSTTASAQKKTNAPVIETWKVSDLDSAIRNASGPTIFNFWATFCIPCIKEIPYFQELTKKYDSAGVKLVLVSLDFAENYPKKIADFAVKRKFTAPIKFLDETNADIFCPVVDKSWSGVLPASLFINHKTGFRSFYEEQISEKKLEEEIRKMIGL